jgi:hypothetical protein
MHVLVLEPVNLDAKLDKSIEAELEKKSQNKFFRNNSSSSKLTSL